MLSFIALCMLLFIGHLLRSKIKLLQWLFLPSCVIGGLFGLGFLKLAGYGVSEQWWTWEVPPEWTAGWSKLPGVLINIVFACLFLGVKIPPLKKVWHNAAPQLAFGQVVAWGQYVVGVGLVLLLLGPMFNVDPIFGAIIPVGFEGGHGTASGLKPTFDELGKPEMKDLAVASATMGMASAIIVGMMLVNLAVRMGYVKNKSAGNYEEDDAIGIIPVDERPSAGKLSVKADAIESFTLNLIFVALAVAIGYLIKWGMSSFEEWLNGDLIASIENATGAAKADLQQTYKENEIRMIVKSFPTFPLCMIGGLLVQLWEQKFDKHKLLDLGLTRRIQNSTLDFLVVAAIASTNTEAVVNNYKPFLIIVTAAIAWNVFCVTFLAKRMLPDAWFERSIAEMGQSMGVTSTGLLLLRVVDPEYRTPAANAFAYKQILHEPFMGGGLWTSVAIPLLVLWGGWPVFGIACGAVAIWLGLTFLTPIIRTK